MTPQQRAAALRLAAVPICDRSIGWQSDATILLRELAAEPQSEPVAWLRHDWSGTGQRHLSFDAPPEPRPVRDEVVNPIWAPLYTHPQQRKPLTDKQIERAWFTAASRKITPSMTEFARAIEAAHGITEAP